MKLIIDADTLVYKAAGAMISKNIETGESVQDTNKLHLYHNCRKQVEKIITKCRDSINSFDVTAYLYLTAENDKESFRLKLFPEYKANRRNLKRPLMYKEAREYYKESFNATVVSGIEADDMVAMEMYRHYKSLGQRDHKTVFSSLRVCDTVLAGIDKDLDQIPGWHYNYNKDQFYFVSILNGQKSFYKQILAGDRVDNIPRIRKHWRSKQCFDAIDKSKSLEEIKTIVYNEYERLYELEAYIKSIPEIEEEITLQGKLLHLKRFEDDEYEYKL